MPQKANVLRNIAIARRYIQGETTNAIAKDHDISQQRIYAIVSVNVRQAMHYCEVKLGMKINAQVRTCTPRQLRDHDLDVLRYLAECEKKHKEGATE